MKKIGMKGGAYEDIEFVLGNQLQEFVRLMDANPSLEPFFCGTTNKGLCPPNANANDVRPEFLQFVISATAAFKEIENPDTVKHESREQYAEKFLEISKDLIKGITNTTTLDTINIVDYIGGLYVDDIQGIYHLIPGFNLVRINDSIPEFDVNKRTNFVNIVKYLYYNISLIDFDKSDIINNMSSIIKILRNDNLYFNEMFYGLINDILNELSETDRSTILNDISLKKIFLTAIENGLTTIIYQIINEFKPLKANSEPFVDINTAIRQTNTFNKDEIKNLLTTLNFDDQDINDISGELDEIIRNRSDILHGESNVSNVATPEEQFKFAHIGIYNKPYLDNTQVNEILPSSVYNISPGPFGIVRNNGKVYSADFLYGKPSNTGDRALIVEDQYKNNESNVTPQSKYLEYEHTVTIKKIIQYISISTVKYTIKNAFLSAFLNLLDLILKYGTNGKCVNDEEAKKEMLDGVKKYQIIHARFVHILKTLSSDKIEQVVDQFLQNFSNEFINSTARFSKIENNELMSFNKEIKQRSNVNKRNLEDPIIRNFYQNVVSVPSNVSFYDKFFVLLYNERPVGLDIAKNINDTNELKKYRLNVKYSQGYEFFPANLRGGAYGDIVFVSYVPSYPVDNSVGNIWITMNDVVPRNVLIANGATESIRDISRKIFKSHLSTTPLNIVGGIQINPANVFSTFVRSGGFHMNWNNILKANLQRFLDKGKNVISQCDVWKIGEDKLRQHILSTQSKWVRQDENSFVFVRLGENGIPEEAQDFDNCAFLEENAQECHAFFNKCVLTDDTVFPEECMKAINKDSGFKINIPPTTIAKQILNMNPALSFAILRKFNFGYYTVTVNDPVPGFRRYVVQTVGEWLMDLQDPEVNKIFGPNAKEIVKQIYQNCNFLNYLSIMVDWVNANPQVLNAEESKNPNFITIAYPKINPSFKLYDYVNPYKKIQVNLNGISCGLERLKSNIMNNMSGIDGYSILSDIVTTPLGISAPFNRSAFTYAVPYANLGTMSGGLYGNTNDILSGLYEATGYKYLYGVYDTLNDIMVKNNNIRLSPKTVEEIKKRLENLKLLEEQIRISIRNMIERNALYNASYGKINAYAIPDKDLPAILAKHSNLLGLTSSYNKKAINLVDILKTISNALLIKLSNNNSNQYGMKRPLSMDFPNSTYSNSYSETDTKSPYYSGLTSPYGLRTTSSYYTSVSPFSTGITTMYMPKY